MNWLTNVVRPKIRNILRRETPENLWIKCPDSGQLVFYKDVEANQFVIPGSNYHMRMGATARLKSIFDNETWYDIALPEVTADPHVIIRARNDELIGLDVLVENELAALRTLDPEILRRLAPVEHAPDLWPDDVGNPVHEPFFRRARTRPGHPSRRAEVLL